ncbi:porin [Paraburkholderia susongensis]|uniref:Outer membrane protein (Porin) n=1 Tax=Paraburkholderia susongensis TaxID=1515439 RepID=A0A1X7LKG4_9BURK|nr:porin [Paraburkholderia susongensis]SMG53984.1 Outer membrane protein (porin) [Paraburkholderia susongensis]
MKYKKTVCAAAVALFSHAAWADSYLQQLLSQWPSMQSAIQQNGISLYGAVDMGLNFQSVSGNSRWQTQSGGVHTSQFGLFGREDLGGGLKAEFNLENGFMANNGTFGTSNTLFDRAAWVGLNSATWGVVRLGLQPTATLPQFIDPFGEVMTNSVVTWLAGGAVQTPKGVGYNADLGPGSSQVLVRENNAATWTTPRIMGFGATFLYAFNGQAGVSPNASNQGVVASWTNGKLYVSGAYNRVWSSEVETASGVQTVRNDIYGVSAIYDVGSYMLSAAFQQVAPKLEGNGIARSYVIGATVPWGRNAVRASVVYRDTSGVRDAEGEPAKDSALGVMLGYDYSLSKRTSLYARAGFIRNYGISTVILNNNPLPVQTGTTTPELGTTPLTASVGIYHLF